MSATGRFPLFAVLGIELPVLASKQLLVRHDFQHCDGQVSAKNGRLQGKRIQPFRLKNFEVLVFIYWKATFPEWKCLLFMGPGLKIMTGLSIESANSSQYS